MKIVACRLSSSVQNFLRVNNRRVIAVVYCVGHYIHNFVFVSIFCLWLSQNVGDNAFYHIWIYNICFVRIVMCLFKFAVAVEYNYRENRNIRVLFKARLYCVYMS